MGCSRTWLAVTTQSIAADLRAIRAHQDRMAARTETRLHLADLAARLGSRLLTTSLLKDYRTREATKHAHALTSALLRQLSTWPPESGASTESIPESIPTNWQAELRVGGEAEKVCHRKITESILSRWRGEPLPENPADLAQYGQAALDLAKGCALTFAQAAYQLARPETGTAASAETRNGCLGGTHRGYPPGLRTAQTSQTIRSP
jgi:hypothetical protein